MRDATRRKAEVEAQFDWPKAIREQRRRKRLSRPDVARRSGLSVSAVKAYERRERHPSREALQAIIDALGLTADLANPILAAAGYATNWRAIFHPAYGPRSIEWFTEMVEQSTWPVFVTNEAADMIAANRPWRLLHGMPPGEQLPRAEIWNALAIASQPWYAERLENWDEAMSFVLGLGKTDLREQVNPERPPTWAAEPYRRFLQGDPALVTRMLKLWEPAEPVAHTTRMNYRVRWRLETGELLRFSAMIHVADIWQVFAWHDWIPADAETMGLLAKLSG